MTKDHVRVRNVDHGFVVFCRCCSADVRIETPVDVTSFVAMMEAFIDLHEQCAERRAA